MIDAQDLGARDGPIALVVQCESAGVLHVGVEGLLRRKLEQVDFIGLDGGLALRTDTLEDSPADVREKGEDRVLVPDELAVATVVRPQQHAEVDAHGSHPDTAGMLASEAATARLRPVLLVDAANVIGSRPDGWWRDRPGAARRFVDELHSARRSGALRRGVVVVLEGQAKNGVAEGDDDGVRIVHAEGEGDDTLARLAADTTEPVVVVTADRGLRDRVRSVDAQVVGPRWLFDRLEGGEIAVRHQAAVDAGEPGYIDPGSGLFVFTSAYHLERGNCCDSGCRHCPY